MEQKNCNGLKSKNKDNIPNNVFRGKKQNKTWIAAKNVWEQKDIYTMNTGNKIQI